MYKTLARYKQFLKYTVHYSGCSLYALISNITLHVCLFYIICIQFDVHCHANSTLIKT